MTRAHASHLRLTLSALAGTGEGLAREWRELAQSPPTSCFQAWSWIGTWLELLPRHLAKWLIRGEEGERCVALGVLTRNTVRRHRWLVSRALHLHETGIRDLDSITVEHNGLVASPGTLERALPLLFEQLLARSDWDELFVGALEHTMAGLYRDAAQRCGLGVREYDRKPFHVVELQPVRDAGGDLLALLSSNSRYQIRRSMRDYERRGALQLAAAASGEEAAAWFERLADLHHRQWQARGRASAFARSFNGEFHRRMIEREFARGAIQLLRVTAGAEDVGYLYNLVHRGCAYAYQSGFAYSEDPRLKPGLVCHVLAVAWNAKHGLTRYDFLAGDSQYKRTLATHGGEMAWLQIQRPRLRFRIEDAARRLRARRGPA